VPEKFMFFDSIDGEDERTYTADDFADYFRQVISTGILNGGTNLKVTCTGSDMNISILEGYSWLEGYLYAINTEALTLPVDVADPALNRIDRVVIRLDKTLENRYIKAFILKGEPSASPVAPAITRNENIYELSLAQLLIIGGKSFLEGSEITDERLDSAVCGLANSLITADTTGIFNQFQAWYDSRTAEYQANWLAWFTTTKSQYEGDWQQWWSDNPDEFIVQWATWWIANPTAYEGQWDAWWTAHPVDYQRRFEEWFAQQQSAGFTLDVEMFLKTDIANTIQTPVYNSEGNVVEIHHTRDAITLRTDVFTYTDDLITETRTLSTGESLQFKHYFVGGNYERTEVI